MAMLYFVFQREAFYTHVDFSLILLLRCDAPQAGFNQEAKGREVGTSPEHVVARLRSDTFSKEGNG